MGYGPDMGYGHGVRTGHGVWTLGSPSLCGFTWNDSDLIISSDLYHQWLFNGKQNSFILSLHHKIEMGGGGGGGGGGGVWTGHHFCQKTHRRSTCDIFYNFAKAKLVFIFQGNKTCSVTTNASLHYYEHLVAQQSHHTSRIWNTSIFRNKVVAKDVS